MVRTYGVLSLMLWPTVASFSIAMVMMLLQPKIKIIRTAMDRPLEKDLLMDVESNKRLFQMYQKNEWKMNRQLPLIFIGGMPRSGTTLLRAMLDAHSQVRCGPETIVIPKILHMHHRRLKKYRTIEKKSETGLDIKALLDKAVGAFILEVIVRHGPLAPRLCNKDPFMLLYGASLINDMFPNGKFIFLARDGRAVTHSIIYRGLILYSYNTTDYRSSLKDWNHAAERMYYQCQQIGPLNCLIVHYEALVLEPRLTMQRICKYLNLNWEENVMHHEKFIGTKIVLSKSEISSRRAAMPIYKDALTEWIEDFPKDVLDEAGKIAPMLTTLGYDLSNGPNYQNMVPFEPARIPKQIVDLL